MTKMLIGTVCMLFTHVFVVAGVHYVLSELVPPRMIEEHMFASKFWEIAGNNSVLVDLIVKETRDGIGSGVELVGFVAFIFAFVWLYLAETTPLYTPSHVAAHGTTWWLILLIGAVLSAGTTWFLLPGEVGGVGEWSVPLFGALLFLTLYYLLGTLLWTARPMRPVVPGAWRFSIL